MKILIPVILMLLAYGVCAQGKFAPSELKPSIGKTFKDEKEIPGMMDYQSRGGALLTAIEAPTLLSVNWFSKNNSILIFFEESLPEEKFILLDLVEVKNPVVNSEVKVGECKDGESDDMEIVALAQSSAAKRWKAIQAWRFNRNKKKIEAWPFGKVTCLGAVGED
jgi:hypothetical protein